MPRVLNRHSFFVQGALNLWNTYRIKKLSGDRAPISWGMGVGPKQFSRIARAHKAFCLKYHHPEEDWLSIALKCGYYDYQHLIKDFQEFAGMTPASYLMQDLQGAPERLFGGTDSSLQK